jgi:hypothetical protein
MKTAKDCRTQWHVIVAYLHYSRNCEWVPTFKLQGVETDFGFIGSSGEQRVRELARNAPGIPPELIGKIEKKREGKYEYFRYRPQLTHTQRAGRMVALFDAGAPADQVFAV